MILLENWCLPKSIALSWEQKFKQLQNVHSELTHSHKELQHSHNELQHSHNDLQNEYDSYKVTTELKISELTKSSESTTNASNSTHGVAFWKIIGDKITSDPEYIKMLIKNKELSLTETNTSGQTILSLAAWRGAYQLTQFWYLFILCPYKLIHILFVVMYLALILELL